MESVVFTLDELHRLDRKQLNILAKYYELDSKGKKEDVIQRIFEHTNPHRFVGVLPAQDIDYGKILLPDETPETPKYSVKIRRIYWSTHMEDLKNGQLDKGS